ncbi:saccharopine dehydrogenase family protein [Microbulbifer agarilyticus]|uniref:saccharopine dehydrogenase family protein n=1 Tax=Microbulbifer agarilyticus TaxID=260552 RepID=UPI001CD5BB52|nr:saccharopine dehydrogenase NADP-binding domain-containing protein [Microbulbifer agarilyticus]MCA0901374.1 saccharopine dehydrogenase NADP-binding domain-containing protein [Microbulbifer agarilyticus]
MSAQHAIRKRVLILGGYGTFGSRIAEMLASVPSVQILIAGRDQLKASLLANRLQQQFPQTVFVGLRLDLNSINFSAQIRGLNLDVVIHCAGPFQGQDYQVARACIEHKVHYLDIADGTDFVTNFETLNSNAANAGICAVAGASSLPALSSAVLGVLTEQFDSISDIDIAIAPAHRIHRGLATVRSGLDALGSEFNIIREGRTYRTYAGAEPRKVHLGHPVGTRHVCDFNIPDLKLIPPLWPNLRNLRFGTGVQPWALQDGLSWCAKFAHTVKQRSTNWHRPWFAKWGHKLAAWWPGGSPHGGMTIEVHGETQKRPATARWQILGLNGDGPWIPAAPAAALARKLLTNDGCPSYLQGAQPCWQLITLQEILQELTPYSVITATQTPAQ